MNGAIIIETRPGSINLVINKHMKYLPGWECTLLHYSNPSNIHHLKHFNYPTKLVKLKQNIRTSREYNELLTSVDFWEQVPYDKVLMFQSDSGILREGIDEFLKWDYVGAPWSFQQFGGNGGLSIRSKDIMIKVLERVRYDHSCNEDVFFCNQMKGHKIGKLAPRSVCEQFSTEAIFKLGTFGYHAVKKYLTKEQCEQIYTQYD